MSENKTFRYDAERFCELGRRRGLKAKGINPDECVQLNVPADINIRPAFGAEQQVQVFAQVK